MIFRKATLKDLTAIVDLLADDKLGNNREVLTHSIAAEYILAFQKINSDPSHFLMVVEINHKVIGTCHLTLTPSLTFQGSNRLTIEAVRIASSHRGCGIGKWMLQQAIELGKNNGAKIIQLTTNKQRPEAKRFYETLGFESTHEGMKIVLKSS